MATTTVTARQVHEVLQDYKICLTGAADATSKFESHMRKVVNPAEWPTDRHRVPPYRPINRELDPEERTLGTNVFETTFLIIMFSGVVTNASIAKLWGKTGGPLFPGLFRYAIGGEW